MQIVLNFNADGSITWSSAITNPTSPVPLPTPQPTPAPTPQPSPSQPGSVQLINLPGQNAHALLSPGETLCYQLRTEDLVGPVTGAWIQFAKEPSYSTLNTWYEATITPTPNDFSQQVGSYVLMGSDGGAIGWKNPPGAGQYEVAIVPPGETWFLNFRIKPGQEGNAAAGPFGRAGLTFYWSVTSR